MTDKLHYLTHTGKIIPVSIADTFGRRFRGLIGKREGEYGLLLSPCNSIHTFFMLYDLDAIFLDKKNRIISIKRYIKPFSVIPPIPKACKVLEFPSSLHASESLKAGDKILLYSYPEYNKCVSGI